MHTWLLQHDHITEVVGALLVVIGGMMAAYLVGRLVGHGLLKKPGGLPPPQTAPSASPRKGFAATPPARKNHEWNPER